MKKLVILIVLLFILGGAILFFLIEKSERKDSDATPRATCINYEAYKYDQEIGACISKNGIKTEQRRGAKIVVDFLSNKGYSNLTLTSIENFRCSGCFNFALEQPNNKNIGVTLNNWEVGSWGDVVDNLYVFE